MKVITQKAVVRKELENCLALYNEKNPSAFLNALHERLLQAKIKFPLLEYCARHLHEQIPEKEQLRICDEIASFKTIGGNVLLGIILQKRLENHFSESFKKAAIYIESGAEWYVTDIIGERVFGVALLTSFEKTISELKKLSRHTSNWVVRSIGPGAHYAIKKGLPKHQVKQLFELLLSLRKTTDFHVKTGIGWAAKTTAKFHPDVIQSFTAEIEDAETGPWFRTKVRIGLERHAYVKIRRSKNNSE